MLALTDQHAHLFLRHSLLGCFWHAHEAQKPIRGAADDAHDGASQSGQPLHRSSQSQVEPLRVAERQPFGHQFAQDQRQNRDDGNHHRQAQRAGIRRQPFEPAEFRRHRPRQPRPAIGSRKDANEGDANLHG